MSQHDVSWDAQPSWLYKPWPGEPPGTIAENKCCTLFNHMPGWLSAERSMVPCLL